MLGRLLAWGVGCGVWVEGSGVAWVGGEKDGSVGDSTLWSVPVLGEKLRRS